MKRMIVVLVVLSIAGCRSQADSGGGGGGGGGGAAAGKERGPCYGNGTCDQGLVCLSQLCVRPAGADCAKVAEHLGSLLLGNYAPREERAAFLTSTQDECVKMQLTKEEGDCILRSEGKQAIGGCPRPLGVGNCATIVDHLKKMKGGDPYLVTSADRLIARCKNEVPSKTLETCVLAAQTMDQLDRCTW